jgi:hypothetical protein
MALDPIAMDCGDGLNCTDSFGGCCSYGYTTIGTDPRFRGPEFSFMLRFRLSSALVATAIGAVGVANSLGAPTNRVLIVQLVVSTFSFQGTVVTDLCNETMEGPTLAKDTNEHSIAWTYGADEWRMYLDGALGTSGPPPCASFTDSTAAADDIFLIAPNTFFDGGTSLYVDRVMYTDSVMPAAQILDIHQNCGSF